MGICLSVFVNDGESMSGQINIAGAAIIHSYNSTFKPKLLTLRDFPGGSAVKNPLAVQEPQKTWVHPWVVEIPWRWAWQPTPVSLPGESLGQRRLETVMGSQRVKHN